MTHRIIVPVDFSEFSEYALEVAANLARTLNAEILVVHLMAMDKIHLNSSESVLVYDSEIHLKLIKSKFELFLKKPYLSGIKYSHIIQEYKNFTELNAIAEDFICDMVVMGSHGSSGLREMFIGSNTEKIVRTSQIPVLVIKNRTENFVVDKVVFACNFSMEFLPSFKKLLIWLEPFSAKLQLLHVNTPDNFSRRSELEEKIFKFLLQAEVEDISIFDTVAYYDDATVEDGIFSYCYKYEADLVAIPTHGRVGLSHYFNRSIGEHLVNHSDIPILTLKI